MNRELDGDIPVDGFRHEVRWHTDHNRIEMHLRAERNMRFHVAGEAFGIAEGETIHTENSHKYNVDEARLLLRAGGWTPLRAWSDEAGLFTLYLASRTKKSLQDGPERVDVRGCERIILLPLLNAGTPCGEQERKAAHYTFVG